MRVSVLIPYFQGRRALLERALWLLRRQTYKGYYNVWILDDGSDENIEELCGENVIYVPIREAGARPRACNIAWIEGYQISDGEFVILTHPEYMVPLHAIESMVDQYDGSARLVALHLSLSPKAQAVIDDFDWRGDVDNLQSIPDFWDSRTPWNWTNRDTKNWQHHFAFTGQTRDAWGMNDFLPETEELGMNDSWLARIEVEQERPPSGLDWYVYHQHHERISEWPFPKKSARVQRILDSGG
jgi:glycosyltransferase involved in cell wall biosynthesis